LGISITCDHYRQGDHKSTQPNRDKVSKVKFDIRIHDYDGGDDFFKKIIYYNYYFFLVENEHDNGNGSGYFSIN
jgi:hypothetical protein